MKVVDQRHSMAVKFKDLNAGQAFLLGSGSHIYMRTTSPAGYISLHTGQVFNSKDDVAITGVNAEVVIKS